jgi:pimeloyl-ACP methyl ester carboxylesterase
MLVFDRQGSGPALLLLHGTNSSRSIWKPLLPQLCSEREVFSVDLPAHGQSPPSSFTPPEWAEEVAVLLDDLGLERVAVVGHSSGGWTALELAKLGRTSGVLALTPAGLWRKHSPPITDAILVVNWRIGQILGERIATKPLHSRIGRRMSLRQISARPADVPAEDAVAMVKTVLASKHFPEHFKQTRRLRFLDGQQIPANIPVHVVWGNKDRIARARTSHHTDQLPEHATIETWADCGHMLMWDARQRVVEAALGVSRP